MQASQRGENLTISQIFKQIPKGKKTSTLLRGFSTNAMNSGSFFGLFFYTESMMLTQIEKHAGEKTRNNLMVQASVGASASIFAKCVFYPLETIASKQRASDLSLFEIAKQVSKSAHPIKTLFPAIRTIPLAVGSKGAAFAIGPKIADMALNLFKNEPQK